MRRSSGRAGRRWRRRWVALGGASALLLMGGVASWSLASHGVDPFRKLLAWVAPDPPVFTVSPIALEAVDHLEPAGHQAMPGNLAPTGQIFFYMAAPEADAAARAALGGVPVRAPGPGVVMDVRETGKESKIAVAVDARYFYFFDRVMPRSGLRAGDPVAAGDVLGTTSPHSASMDFGLVDRALEDDPRFARPERFNDEIRWALCPLDRFVEPLRAQLSSRMLRLGGGRERLNGRCGDRVQDLEGTARGVWFHGSLPRGMEAFDRPNWPKHLAITRPAEDPGQVWVGFGPFLGEAVAGIHQASAAFEPEAMAPGGDPVCVALRQRGAEVDAAPLAVMWLRLREVGALEVAVQAAPATCETAGLGRSPELYVR